MAPSEEPDVELHSKVHELRDLLQKPSNADKIGPLVTALLARKVDIHAKMLTGLRDKLKNMEEALSTGSEHTSRVAERMNNIEQDVIRLQKLVQSNEQDDGAIKADLHQLSIRLTETIKQNSMETANFEKNLQLVREAIEERERAAKDVMGSLLAQEQHIAGLGQDIHELANGVQKLSSNAPGIEAIVQKITSTAELGMNYLQRDSSATRDIGLSAAAHEDPEYGHAAKDEGSNSIEKQTSSYFETSQADQAKPKTPEEEDWPAITEFITTYELWRTRYKSQKPKNNPKFIENFLNELNVHVSCALQRHLLEAYPQKVALAAPNNDQLPPTLFITLRGLRWLDIRRTLHMKNLKFLQWAVDNCIYGPSPSPHAY
ncbi:hypothetical protein F5Y07DRAFT_114233 [Xylaria sp. FL0933]|nr:hypothetical protein F5Y07DRAFT_114233 [Xylaria sp. FL0933]